MGTQRHPNNLEEGTLPNEIHFKEMSKCRFPPCRAESPGFPKCQHFPGNSRAVPAQPELGAALAHPGETFLPRVLHKVQIFLGRIPFPELPALGLQLPTQGREAGPGAQGYFYCCVYCLLNEPPRGLVPFRGGEGTLSSRGCCARCGEGDGNSLRAPSLACGPKHPPHPLGHASVLLHLGC